MVQWTRMNVRLVSLIAIALALSGCNHQPPAREYELKGQILGVEPARNEVLIRHENIKPQHGTRTSGACRVV